MRQKNRAAPRPRPLPGSASDAFGRAVWEGERAGRGPMILIDDAKSSRSIVSFAPRGAVSGRRRCYAVHLDAPRETNDGTVEPSHPLGKTRKGVFTASPVPAARTPSLAALSPFPHRDMMPPLPIARESVARPREGNAGASDVEPPPGKVQLSPRSKTGTNTG